MLVLEGTGLLPLLIGSEDGLFFDIWWATVFTVSWSVTVAHLHMFFFLSYMAFTCTMWFYVLRAIRNNSGIALISGELFSNKQCNVNNATMDKYWQFTSVCYCCGIKELEKYILLSVFIWAWERVLALVLKGKLLLSDDLKGLSSTFTP